MGQVNRDRPKEGPKVNRISTTAVALFVASVAGLLPASAGAQNRGRQDRYEDRRDRLEDRWDRREDRWDAREDRWDARDDRKAAKNARKAQWDAAKAYRKNARYRARRLGRNDVVYRGSDDRYYCKRDDGTTGLILGGIAGGALGHIIAPGGSKTLGAIVGAGAGALIGRAIDNGEVVCE
jgi:uncharacterized protein YcfJ